MKKIILLLNLLSNDCNASTVNNPRRDAKQASASPKAGKHDQLISILVDATADRVHPGVHAARVDLFSWYWHFVDGVWIAVLLVVYGIGVQP